jgi:hypothetical protein
MTVKIRQDHPLSTKNVQGLDLLKPHWVPVYWSIFWTTGRIPDFVFHETERLDDDAVFGWWQPKIPS